MIHLLDHRRNGVTVSTLDSESADPSSNLGSGFDFLIAGGTPPSFHLFELWRKLKGRFGSALWRSTCGRFSLFAAGELAFPSDLALSFPRSQLEPTYHSSTIRHQRSDAAEGFVLPLSTSRSRGAMDNASAYGAEDSGFESLREYIFDSMV